LDDGGERHRWLIGLIGMGTRIFAGAADFRGFFSFYLRLSAASAGICVPI
jgi:hypothetical protein